MARVGDPMRRGRGGRKESESGTAIRLLRGIALILAVSVLSLAREILIPLSLAILLSFLLVHPVSWLERCRFGRVLAVTLVTILSVACLGGVGWIVFEQMSDLVAELPKHSQEIKEKLSRMRASGSQVKHAIEKVIRAMDSRVESKAQPSSVAVNERSLGMEEAAPTKPTSPFNLSSEESPIFVRMVSSPDSMLLRIPTSLGQLLFPLSQLFMVAVFAIFILVQREDLRNRLLHVVSRGRLQGATQVIQDATARVSGYLLTQFWINGSYGLAVAAGLYFLSVPSWALWGFLAAAFRFLPYVGPWLGALPPLALLAATSDGWAAPLIAVSMFLSLDIAVYLLIEPWLYGVSTGVSPFAILVAAVFWTWIWGPVGLVVATPLTVCFVVAGKYFPQLRYINELLGDEDPLTPGEKYYQRLLARAPDDAAALVAEARSRQTLEQVYDEILIPALVLADNDASRGDFDDETLSSILIATRKIFSSIDGTLPAALSAESTPVDGEQGAQEAQRGHGKSIAFISTPNEVDGLAVDLMARAFAFDGYATAAILGDLLVSEVIDRATELSADVLCIVALSTSSRVHARALAKRIRPRVSSVRLLALQTVLDTSMQGLVDGVAASSSELLRKLAEQ